MARVKGSRSAPCLGCCSPSIGGNTVITSEMQQNRDAVLYQWKDSGSVGGWWPLHDIRTSLPAWLQTIYNAITNGTPCVVVEGSGRVADVIAQVANLPVPKITIALIRKKLSVLFHDTYELFTEGKLVEWTKKVSLLQAGSSFL